MRFYYPQVAFDERGPFGVGFEERFGCSSGEGSGVRFGLGLRFLEVGGFYHAIGFCIGLLINFLW